MSPPAAQFKTAPAGFLPAGARFGSGHRKSPARERAIYGQEKERAAGDEARARIQEIFGVAQVSKPAVSPTSKSAARAKGESSAGLKTGDTADSEVCATLRYKDVPGLCRAAALKEIETQGWSLTFARSLGWNRRMHDG